MQIGLGLDGGYDWDLGMITRYRFLRREREKGKSVRLSAQGSRIWITVTVSDRAMVTRDRLELG
eukprot:1331867-Amorphochlora_amoeboformis.AAC.1